MASLALAVVLFVAGLGYLTLIFKQKADASPAPAAVVPSPERS
jgi:hypothetical protein